jgi:hypothetical protein
MVSTASHGVEADRPQVMTVTSDAVASAFRTARLSGTKTLGEKPKPAPAPPLTLDVQVAMPQLLQPQAQVQAAATPLPPTPAARAEPSTPAPLASPAVTPSAGSRGSFFGKLSLFSPKAKEPDPGEAELAALSPSERALREEELALQRKAREAEEARKKVRAECWGVTGHVMCCTCGWWEVGGLRD